MSIGAFLRRAVAVALSAVAALAFSGCVQIGGVQLRQADLFGDQFTISAGVCATGPSCRFPPGNLGFDASPAQGQLLVGIRMPVALGDPTSIALATGANAPVLTPSAGYAAELERLLPSEAGLRWLGYISEARTWTGAPTGGTLTATWRVPRDAEGRFVVSTVKHRVVVGFRAVSDPSAPASRPVACDATDPAAYTAPNETICVEAPRIDTVRAGNLSETLNDLVLGAAPETRVAAGGLAELRFPLWSTGVGPEIWAASSVPGATPGAQFQRVAGPRLGSLGDRPGRALQIGPAATETIVPVKVPLDTPPGRYTVSVEARAAAYVRSAQATLVVTPPLSAFVPRVLSVGSARARGIRVLAASSVAGRATLRLFQPGRDRALAVRIVRLTAGERRPVLLRSRLARPGAYRVTFSLGGRITTVRGTLRR